MGTRSRVSRAAVCLVGFFAAVTVLTVIGFLIKSWLPPVASRHGEDVDALIHFLLVTTGVVFVLGHAVLAWMIWRYRHQEGTEYRPVSVKAEWLWVGIPAVLLVVVLEIGALTLGRSAWNQVHSQAPQDAIEIEVVGRQFEWLVHYAGKDGQFGRTRPELVHEVINPLGLDKKDATAIDDLFVRGILRVPVGRTALIRLRTHDVQHAFAVAAFRVKQDLVPGLTTQTQFEPTKPGQYELICAELCGLGHFQMRGLVIVMSQQEYDEWLAEQVGWFE